MFPNPQDALPLPPRPSIEQYKKLAVLTVARNVAEILFCGQCYDYHMTTFCVRKPVPNERHVFGTHKAGRSLR
jgi:hypothetical protein